MKIKPMHDNFTMPAKSTSGAGAFDLFMLEDGSIGLANECKVSLGFAMEVPEHHVAILLPRSGVGFKHGLELNNTCGIIDSDYRGEVFAMLRTKSGFDHDWKAGDRLLQMLIVPVFTPELEIVDELSETDRGVGGIGSTGL